MLVRDTICIVDFVVQKIRMGINTAKNAENRYLYQRNLFIPIPPHQQNNRPLLRIRTAQTAGLFARIAMPEQNTAILLPKQT